MLCAPVVSEPVYLELIINTNGTRPQERIALSLMTTNMGIDWRRAGKVIQQACGLSAWEITPTPCQQSNTEEEISTATNDGKFLS